MITAVVCVDAKKTDGQILIAQKQKFLSNVTWPHFIVIVPLILLYVFIFLTPLNLNEHSC